MRRRAMLLHPVAIVAVLALLLNDHVLKAALPGLVTGKLSDFAGLAFFPLLLAVLAGPVLRRDSRGLVPAAAVATAAAFALVKLTAPGAAAFAWSLGAAQWLLVIALTGHATLQPVAVARDPTDLIALPSVLVAVAIARRARPEAISLHPPAARARFAPVAMAALMALSTMATEEAQPSVSATTSPVMALSVGRPIAARHLRWSAALASGSTTGNGSVSVWVFKTGGDEFQDTPRGVNWMIVPDDRSPGAMAGDVSVGFPCDGGCTGGAAIVAWLQGPGAPQKISLTAQADLQIPVAKAEQASAASVSLMTEEGGDKVATAQSSVHDRFRVSLDASGPHNATVTARVHVPASALDGVAGWPLVGRVDVDVKGTAASRSRDDFAYDDTVVGPGGVISDHDQPTDWLAECQPNVDCDFKVNVAVSYFDSTGNGSSDRQGWAEGEATITVSLFAFDGRKLPAHAVAVTAGP